MTGGSLPIDPPLAPSEIQGGRPASVGTPVRQTRILESYYCGLDSWSSPFNYRLLRGGRIATGSEYRIDRQSVPGHEFLLNLSGVGNVRIAGAVHRVDKGQLAWLPGQWPHAHFSDPDDPWETIWLRVDGSNLHRLQTLLGVDADPVFSFAAVEAVHGLMEDALVQMRQHSMLAAAASDRIVAALVEKLMESRSTHLLDPVVASHRGLARLLGEVRTHYNEPWPIERFAETCRVSKSHLFRLFRYAFGQTPGNWLKSYRIAEAKRMLVETDEPVGNIARAVGYEDPLHFSRDFSRNVGTSPRRFRDVER